MMTSKKASAKKASAKKSAPATNPPTKPPTNPPTSDILSQLYDETNGDAWSNKTGWKDVNTPVCNWHGVNCSIYDEVIELDLRKSLEHYSSYPNAILHPTNIVFFCFLNQSCYISYPNAILHPTNIVFFCFRNQSCIFS